ncbi:MAG: DNA-binding transcriptional regulator BaeR [Bacteroidetes bacterium]|jgi:CheY-like chemotaxis protein|nr:DNA-binding transcriptional regulator BaeR [Bacteroidota bacterium]
MSPKIKILILEDNESDAELLQRELKKSGMEFSCEVVQARDPYETMLDHYRPDIILSDYSLPSFDGLSAFHIKQKKYPDIPFIIVSGTIGEENAVELIKTGVTDYVLKDKLLVLNQKIHRALKEVDEILAKKLADEKLKLQNEKLFEIAFLQSHQVRAPVANVLGLLNLFNLDNPHDPLNSEVIRKLQSTTLAFDTIIHQIMQKTSEIRKMQ